MNLQNTLFCAFFSAAILLGATVSAKAENSALNAIPGEFSANVGVFSDYVYRGVSQSDENPALQGGVDYSYDNANDQMPGVYVGAWASNVDFNDGDEAVVEIDLYAGVTGTFEEIGADWDLGATYFWYPGADSNLNYNFWEYTAKLSKDFDMFEATASYSYSPEFFGEAGNAHYTSLGFKAPLPLAFNANGHVGYQAIEDGSDYTDWSLGLGYAWQGMDFGVTYTDTDLKDPQECDDICSARVVFSVSKTF